MPLHKSMPPPLTFKFELFKVFTLLFLLLFNSSPHNIYHFSLCSNMAHFTSINLKLTNLSSSLDVKYGSGLDFEPSFTLPDSLSFSVVLGTLYSCAALLTPFSPFFTASIALVIELSSHSLRFFRFIPHSSLSLLFRFFHPFLAGSALLHLGII